MLHWWFPFALWIINRALGGFFSLGIGWGIQNTNQTINDWWLILMRTHLGIAHNRPMPKLAWYQPYYIIYISWPWKRVPLVYTIPFSYPYRAKSITKHQYLTTLKRKNFVVSIAPNFWTRPLRQHRKPGFGWETSPGSTAGLGTVFTGHKFSVKHVRKHLLDMIVEFLPSIFLESIGGPSPSPVCWRGQSTGWKQNSWQETQGRGRWGCVAHTGLISWQTGSVHPWNPLVNLKITWIYGCSVSLKYVSNRFDPSRVLESEFNH